MFPEMLKYLRKRAGLKQNELATKLGIKQNTVSSYENGVREPDFEMLETIADFFNVSIDTLLGKPETPYKKEKSTGETADLNDDEMNLIKNYRKLPPEWKERIQVLVKQD